MSAIAFFFSIPATLWSGWLIVRGPLLVGCVVVLAAMCCLSGELWSVQGGGLDWTVDRFLFIGLCIALGVQWHLGRAKSIQLGWHDWVLAAFLGILLLSTFTHDWRISDERNGSILMHLVNGYLIPVGIFTVARFAKLDERQWRCATAIFAAFGLYLAVTAILEISGQWSLVFPSYIGDPTRGIHFGRARGPMLQSARLGLYLVTCGAVTVVLLSWRRGFRRWGVAVAALLLPVYLAAIYYTYTRSVWMGAVLVAMLIAGLTLRGRARYLAIGLMVIAIGSVILIKGDQLIAFKREYSAAETRQSTQMRASFAYVSWKMFKQRPLTGFGFGQFPQQSRFFLSDRSSSLHLEHIRGYIHHNTFLSLLVEMGIVSLVLFIVILAHWAYSGWRIFHDSRHPEWVRFQGLFLLCVLAAYSVQLLFREVSYSPVENSLVFLFAGLTLSLRQTYEVSRAAVRRRAGAAAGCSENETTRI